MYYMTWLSSEDKYVECTQNVIMHWDNDHSSTKGQCTSHDVTSCFLEFNAAAVIEHERSMWKDMVEEQTTTNKCIHVN